MWQDFNDFAMSNFGGHDLVFNRLHLNGDKVKMRISASNLAEMEKVENVQVLLRRISCSVDEKAVR